MKLQTENIQIIYSKKNSHMVDEIKFSQVLLADKNGKTGRGLESHE